MDYNEQNRSKVQYLDRFKQPILFEGMIFQKISPTDIDCFNEYHGRFWLFMEVKQGNAPFGGGQRKSLERTVDQIQKSGADAVLFIARHNTPTPNPVTLKTDSICAEAYFKGQWYQIKPKTAGDAWEYAMNWAKDWEIYEAYERKLIG